MAKYESWDDIDRDSNGLITSLTYTVLFINDQIYNYSLILHEALNGTPYYRHKVKYLCNQIKKKCENYNLTTGRANLTELNKTTLAIITASMEEDLEKYISMYRIAVSNVLLKNDICGEKNNIVSICSTLNTLVQMSDITIKDFGEYTSQNYNVSVNPLKVLSLNIIDKLSYDLCNSIVGDVIVNLNKYPQIMQAFTAIMNNLLKPEVFNKAFDEAEKI
jgi:hypothetical protein